MSNKSDGENFEKEVLNILKENNFWATKLKEKENGGPFDIVATKNNTFYSLEAKRINNGTKFNLNRVESNQISAFKRLLKVNSSNYSYFIFKTKFGTFLLKSEAVIKHIEDNEKAIDVSDGIKFENWLNIYKESK